MVGGGEKGPGSTIKSVPDKICKGHLNVGP